MCCTDADPEYRFDVFRLGACARVKVIHLKTGKIVTALQGDEETELETKQRALEALRALVRGESENP